MDTTQLSYTFNANGYMLTYRGRNIGGAGVMLPRSKPLHWQHKKSNLELFRNQASRELEHLKQSQGRPDYFTTITKIDKEILCQQ
jgi:hypothetical protein